MSGYIARKYAPVTPSNTTDLPGGFCHGLLIGTAGVATLTEPDGTVRTGVPLQAGFNPIAALRVHASGLTAAGIWALY